MLAKRAGAKLFIINMTPTQLDYMADGVIHGDIVETLEEIEKSVSRGSGRRE